MPSPFRDEKKTERLNLVVTPTADANLKRAASVMGISVNELVERIARNELSGEDLANVLAS
jgi:predicted HicB family RNase H-like nuclease